MTMPGTCPVSSGRGQLLEARNCLLATSLGTAPGARAKSFSDALDPVPHPDPHPQPPHCYACLSAITGESCNPFYLKKAQD